MNLNSPSLLIIGRLSASALALGSAPIVARAIGPAGRGETAGAIALFTLIPIFIGLGIHLETRRIIAADTSTLILRKVRRLLPLGFLVSFPLASLISFTIIDSYSEAAKYAVFAGIALTPLTLSWICDTSALVALRDYFGIFILQIFQPGMYLLFVLILWSSDLATTSSVIWAYTLSNITSFIYGLFRVKIPSGRTQRTVKELAGGSIRFAGGTFAESASNRLDQIIALNLIGSIQTGYYSIAVTIALAPVALAQAMSALSFTPVVQSTGSGKKILINTIMQRLASLAFFTSAILWIVGPSLVVMIFGREFSGASDSIRILTIACFFANVSFHAAMVLTAEGKRLTLTFCQLSSLLIGIAFLFLLGPSMGASGASWASVIGFASLTFLCMPFAGISFKSLVPTPKAFVAGIQTVFNRRSI